MGGAWRRAGTDRRDAGVNGVVDRLRPLCPYPQVAVYKGQGDTNDAANFECRAARSGRVTRFEASSSHGHQDARVCSRQVRWPAAVGVFAGRGMTVAGAQCKLIRGRAGVRRGGSPDRASAWRRTDGGRASAIRRAHRLARLTRALSVAMPVFAYICLYSFEISTKATRERKLIRHRDRAQMRGRL